MSVRTVVMVVVPIIAAPAVHVPAVTAAIGGVEVWPTEVVIVAMRIAGIDAEVPVACLPTEGAEEIGGCAVEVPLPAIENVVEIGIAALPVGPEHVVSSRHSHQIVEIYLIGSFVLGIREIQLIGHLVRQEQGFAAGLLVTHGTCLKGHGHYCYQGKYYFLHNRKVFSGSTIFFLFLLAKVGRKRQKEKGFSLNEKRKIPILLFQAAAEERPFMFSFTIPTVYCCLSLPPPFSESS